MDSSQQTIDRVMDIAIVILRLLKAFKIAWSSSGLRSLLGLDHYIACNQYLFLSRFISKHFLRIGSCYFHIETKCIFLNKFINALYYFAY